ncbi:MAG: sugar ABC transporter substrate-binding protein, partial [Desulfotomaculales bacterium]
MAGKNFRLALLVFVMAAALFFPGACGKNPQRKPSDPAVKVAVAAADMQWDGMQVMRAAVEKRSRQEGVEITWLDAGNDISRQKKQVEDLLNKAGAGANSIKAVVFQPVDPLQSVPLVEALVRSGVKVLALEKLVPNVPLDGYIASDHLQTGRLQARYAVNSAAGSPGFLNAVIFRGDPADPAVREIVDGIKGALNEKVRIIGEVDHLRIDPAAAGQNILAVLRKSKVDVLFATDGRLAAGAAAALKAAGLQNSVVTIGAGADRTASRSLLAGDHDAEIDPMPDLMGQYVLDAAASLAKTGHWQYETRVDNGNYSVPAKITPVRLIDKTNAYLL